MNKLILAVPAIAAVAVLVSAGQPPAAASPSPAPNTGVSIHNANLCGTNKWT